MFLVCKVAAEGLEDSIVDAEYPRKLEYVQRTLLSQINLFVDALIAFYGLEALVTSTRDLRRELLFNLITNLVLADDVYWLVHNLTCVTREADLLKVRKVMDRHSYL
jgi:CRISPR/Cas system CMR-associated protein Cmr3 (group 5 of RAMP superfamily)